MGLGILEDRHLDHVPGTALLADMVDAEHHQFHGRKITSRCTHPRRSPLLGRDTSGLKHAKGRNVDIVLVPQPSDSPRDPLNWPTWKKDLLLLIISIDTAVVGAWG